MQNLKNPESPKQSSLYVCDLLFDCAMHMGLWTKFQDFVYNRNLSPVYFQGIKVQVRSVYIEGRSQPLKSQFFFAYRIRITNNSNRPVQLLRRHWIITDANGKTENVWLVILVLPYSYLSHTVLECIKLWLRYC